jgi:nicotinic acid mononucleotide adenylyltransferase
VQRVEILTAAVSHDKSYSVAATDGGLFEEIAQECRAAYGSGVRLSFLCGRDAAERIVSWDYGRPEAVSEMLRRFDLLVAARGGEYTPPPEFVDFIAPLAIREGLDFVSSTEVRRRIARCEPWEHLVPPAIVQQIRNYYL